jgi:biopolymer transport protein ExbB
MSRRIYLAVFAAVLLSSLTALAQEKPVQEDTPSDTERMERAISELQEQIVREREKFTAGKLGALREIEQLRAQRDGHLIGIESLKDDIARLAQSNAAKRTGIENASTLVAQEKKLLDGIAGFVTASLPELAELVHSSISGSDSMALDKEAAALAESMNETSMKPVETAGHFFDLAGRLLERSRAIEVYRGEVLASSGAMAGAKLLRVGEITSIYLLEDGSEAGVLLRSPVDESGRRYERNIPGSTVSAIRGLFSGQGTPDGVVSVPLDVSQGMLVGVSYGERGFVSYLARGGPVMVPLLAVALLALILIIEKLFALRRESKGATRFAGEVAETYRAKGLASALTLAKGGRGAVARIMRAGLEKAGASPDIFEESVYEAALAELPRIERSLPSIAVLATVAPLLGLLGTVTGMISAFDTITAYGTSDPRLLSGGISEALVTTMVGLIIAIPVLLVHGFLSAKVDRITADMEQASSRLIAAVMEGAGKNEPAGEKADA